MSKPFALDLLNGFALLGPDGAPIHLPLKRAKALLAYLAMESGRPHSRDELVALLWDDMSQDQARHNLRQLLSSIRKALPQPCPPLLTAAADCVSLDLRLVEVDAIRFERLSAAPDTRSKREAAALYGGGFLSGFELSTPGFGDWCSPQRERLRETAVGCLLHLMTALAAEGQSDEAILFAKKALTLDPLQEDVHRFLMRIYAEQGKQSLAIRQYRRCAEALERELGVAPDDETRKLYLALAAARTASGAEPAIQTHDAGTGTEPRATAETGDGPVPPRLIGREKELSAIRPILRSLRAGRGGAVALIGEAGVGKSRLADEIIVRAGGGRAPILVTAPPGEQEGDQEDCDAVQAALLQHAAFAPAAAAGKPERLDERIHDSLRAIAGQAAERQPVVIVADGLQNLSDGSLRSLTYLSGRLASLPLLLIVTARGEELHRNRAARRYLNWLRLQNFAAVIDLQPFSATETAALLEQAQRRNGRPTAAVSFDAVWRFAEGNPLVALELLRAGAPRIAVGDGGAPPLPARVIHMIAAQLEPLPPDVHRAMEAASALGRAFAFDIWRTVAQLDHDRAVAILETLVARHLLALEGDRLRFVHERVRAYLYASLLPPRRVQLHALAARALQSLPPAKLGPHFGALATHWLAAGDPAAAAACQVRAAEFATDCGRRADAERHAKEALDLLARSDAGASTAETRLEAGSRLIDLLQDRCAFEESAGLLASLKPISRAVGDPSHEGRLLMAEARRHYVEARLAAAFAAARRGLRLTAIAGGEGPWMPADHILPRMHMVLRQGEATLQGLAARARAACEEGALRSEALQRAALGLCRSLLGDRTQAEADCRTSIALAEAAGDGRCLAACLQHFGQVLTWQGDAAAALAHFDRAMAIARSGGDLFRLYPLHAFRGRAQHMLLRHEAARQDLLRALDHADRLMTRFLLPQFTGYLAEACVAAGLEDDALLHGRRALRLAAEANQPWSRSIALRALGAVMLRRSPANPEAAERALRTALTIQEGLELGFEAAVSRQLLQSARKPAQDQDSRGMSGLRSSAATPIATP